MKEKDNEDDKRKIYLGDKMRIQNVMKVGVKNYSVYNLTAKPGDERIIKTKNYTTLKTLVIFYLNCY